MMNLALALHYEHKARTGHDSTQAGRSFIRCDVCLHLNAFWREQEKAEADYYQNISKEADALKAALDEKEVEG